MARRLELITMGSLMSNICAEEGGLDVVSTRIDSEDRKCEDDYNIGGGGVAGELDPQQSLFGNKIQAQILRVRESLGRTKYFAIIVLSVEWIARII